MDEILKAIHKIASEGGETEFVTINRNQYRDAQGAAVAHALAIVEDVPPEVGLVLTSFAARVNATAWRLLTGKITREELGLETI